MWKNFVSWALTSRLTDTMHQCEVWNISRVQLWSPQTFVQGAALVVAGLAATGMTEIGDVFHIDRGYDNLVGRLVAIGALVERVDLAVS